MKADWIASASATITSYRNMVDAIVAQLTDEELRQRIVHTACERLVEDLANPKRLWESWKQLFRSVGQYVSDVDGIPHARTYAGTLEPEEVA